MIPEGKIFFLLSFGIAVFVSDVCGVCQENGKTYQTGDRFTGLDGCNTCTCMQDGSIACTEIGCPDTCYYKNQAYKKGLIFKDGCDTCTCTDELSVICDTSSECLARQGICIYEGQTYMRGDRFNSTDGCNTCYCAEVYVQPVCTKVDCGPGCQVNGQTYAVGRSWLSTKDNCNTCTCQGNNNIQCTQSEACTGCHHHGIVIPYGQNHKAKDGCNTINCDQSSGMATTFMACPLGDHYKCAYNNKFYKSGDQFPSGDGCNTCTCDNYGVSCTEIGCPDIQIKETCSYNGKTIPQDKTFRGDPLSACYDCYCDRYTGYPTCNIGGCIDYTILGRDPTNSFMPIQMSFTLTVTLFLWSVNVFV